MSSPFTTWRDGARHEPQAPPFSQAFDENASTTSTWARRCVPMAREPNTEATA